ncbi:MAG: branched-chain amino acid ABC transporter substrate-binding protein [Deltaproteobacteria bacterium]|nr:branched-chain amino acid ABC transporter substrate-binding protein [Deltaproteobacteria bacterium]MBW2019995.1 branched-chain amino acid ABC transporter substrate-binding protein [Deltaproteobacteria bacterium]MBW2075056.1 branched-chain amino acid ABC transporter substrate-binding protein [Deltaproteobacteria bacterium]
MTHKTRLLFIGTLFCFLFTLSVVHADEWGTIIIPPDKPIKIGLGAMLTGDYASMGIDIKNGAEMAVQEKGTILGHRVILQAEDDGCAGPSSVAIAEKLCNDPLVVGLVGYMCSGGSKPASDIHNKYKVVMISPSSTALELTARGIPIFFRTCWNDKIQARRAAGFALSRNWKNVAVLHDKSDYGQSLAEDFARHIRNKGGKILALEGITRGDKDFSPVLTKIKPLRPQLIYFGGMAAEGALIARQMKRVGIKAHFMSDDGCYTKKDFIQAGGKATTGCYVTYAKEPDPAWVKRFEARYGPRQTFSPQAYDAANILMMAVEKVAKRQADGSLVIGKKALRDAVSKTEYEGITGKIAFDPNGDRTGSVVVIYEVVQEKGERFFKPMQF